MRTKGWFSRRAISERISMIMERAPGARVAG
jgi:hypothetical protein